MLASTLVCLLRWTCAFKHTYYTLLQESLAPPQSNPHHVVVCGDDGDAAAVTMALVDSLPGFRYCQMGYIC